jgi:hypothetical protein
MECRDQGQISIPDKLDIETQVLDFSGNLLTAVPTATFSGEKNHSFYVCVALAIIL